VAIVPRGYAGDPLRSVGVGLVPGAEGRRALRAAAALARAVGAPLLVLTILRRSPDADDAAALAAQFAPGVAADTRGPEATLRTAIDAAARANDMPVFETAPDGPLVVEPRLLVGEPADALLRASARVGVLVLGSRAYGPPGVVLPGGTALRVLGSARSPVLLIPRAQ
jgi:nucleotide-binding universal stress UspA family protein